MLTHAILHSPPLVLPSVFLAILCMACGDSAPGVSTDTLIATSTGPADPLPPTSSTGATTEEELVPSTSPATDASETTGATGGTGPGEVEDEPPVCGDGRTDPGEQCDYGEEGNGDNKFCTDACKVNICGDGLYFDGAEHCDEGAANSDEYGSICTQECKRGVWCGDNIVQPDHEQCDNGPENGTLAEDEQGISCDTMCRMKARRIFITKHMFTGNLGGLSGADEKCRKAALEAQLPEPERFMALLSDAGASMKSRYEDKIVEPLPYVLLTGMKIADSYTALVQSGPGDLGVHIDENFETVLKAQVASNTATDGSIYQEFDDQDKLKVTDCDGWTTDSKLVLGHLGLNGVALDHPDHDAWKQSKQWLSWSTVSCNDSMRLYCIEL